MASRTARWLAGEPCTKSRGGRSHSKLGEDIAERYVAHQAVESRRAMKKYMDCCVDLGYRPVGAREVERIEKRYDAAIARYGHTFKSDYGWAAHHLKKTRPTFADLEAAAGRATMRAHYQMGSDNVHAGIKSMYGRLGLMMDYDSLLAGRSNAGLTDPGQNAAHTLTQIAVLVCLSPKLDDLVAGNIIQILREEIPDSFWQADSAFAEGKRPLMRPRANADAACLRGSKMAVTKILGPLHFEDLEPHRFEDLVRELVYELRDWQSIEATGRRGADEGLGAIVSGPMEALSVDD